MDGVKYSLDGNRVRTHTSQKLDKEKLLLDKLENFASDSVSVEQSEQTAVQICVQICADHGPARSAAALESQADVI